MAKPPSRNVLNDFVDNLHAAAGAVGAKLAEQCSIMDFGAVPGDPGKAAANKAAIEAALAASPSVYFPDGETFCTASVAIPPTARRLYGAATLIAPAGSIPAGLAVLTASNSTGGLIIEDLAIRSDPDADPKVSGIIVSSTSNATIQKVRTDGCQFGIYVSGGRNNKVLANTISGYGSFGIYAAQAPHSLLVHGNAVGAGRSHAIIVDQGTLVVVSGNQISGPGGGGIWIVRCRDFAAIGNVVHESHFEAVHADSSNVGVISDNSLWWESAGADVGISVSNDNGPLCFDVVVSGNTLHQPFKSGIYITGAQRTNVVANHITNANRGDSSLRAAIVVSDAKTSVVSVTDNLIYSDNGNIDYQVKEYDATGGGAPDNNFIGPNKGSLGKLGENFVSGANTLVYDARWSDYVPAVSASSGQIRAKVNKACARRNGDQVFVYLDVTIVDGGTGAGNVLVEAPFGLSPAIFAGVLNGRQANGNAQLVATLNGAIGIALADQSYPGATGNRLIVNGSFWLGLAAAVA